LTAAAEPRFESSMKIIRDIFCALCALAFGFNQVQAGLAGTSESSLRLTIELRDGSRVVGESVDGKFKFHSVLLGDLKLDVNDILSINCAATNVAKLTTVKGDVLTGWFVASVLRVETSFGKTELPVNLIGSVRISPRSKAGQLPSGLVELWSGEGDGSDSVSGNNAMLTDISFSEGKVGQAFSFNGTSSYFKIPDSPTLDVGAGEGFTVMAWIKPSDIRGLHPILEWQPGEKMPSPLGIQLWIGENPASQGVLCAFFIDTNGNNFVHLPSPEGTLVANTWQHVAVTYSQASGTISLYVNGKAVSKLPWGSFVPLTKGDLASFRPGNPGDWTYNRFFAGLMDELAIYNRALSASEIQAICMEQNNGEPLPAPPASRPVRCLSTP
jgi:Concanavalin A-like lectin/glucanases superfamily